jgi:heat shock protein HslJ
VLQRLNFDQPALAEGTITANFADSRVSGTGGCNEYSADVTSDSAQLLAVGPVAGIMMACDDGVTALEAAYLTALQRATEWRYYPGQLAITYLAEDGAQGTLFFNPKNSTEASREASF